MSRQGRRHTVSRLSSRGGMLALISFLTVTVGALIPDPDVVRAGLFGLALIPLSWPLARWNLSRLSIQRALPQDCFVGQLFSTDLLLSNNSHLLPRFSIELEDGFAGPSEKGLSTPFLAQGTTVRRSMATRMLRRGTHHRIRCGFVSEFPLGIWHSRREIRDHIEFTVFPRPVLPRALEDSANAGFSDADIIESNRPDSSGDLHGIRRFQPGDRLKMIHWPASARTSELMVRLYDRPLPHHYFIAYHSISPTLTDNDRAEAFEGAMELVCGLFLNCKANAIPFDFAASFNDWRTLRVRDAHSMDAALHLLAAARRTGERDPAALIRAIAANGYHTRIFLLSDVPVREWEPLLPEFPCEVTCLSIFDLRIRRPGRIFRMVSATPPASQSPA